MAKIQQKQVNLAAGVSSAVTEVLSVLDSNNTLTNLTGSPTGRVFMLFVNGVMYSPYVKNPPFTINSQTLVWSTVNAGFALEQADAVVCIYTSASALPSSTPSNTVKTTV